MFLGLASGRRVPFLCYADDVVLMAESAVALQRLIDGMHDSCNCAGLTTSVAKTEVVVFHGVGVSGVWSVGGHLLPRSESLKYLGLVFHESGQVDVMFQRLYRNALGSVARLVSSFKQLGCSSSLPMKRRLFATLVAPAASYGCEVWGGHFRGRLIPQAAQLLSIQAGILQGLCSLPKSGSALPMFAESAEEPWDMQWWRQVVRFALRLKGMGVGLCTRTFSSTISEMLRPIQRLAIGRVSLSFVLSLFACQLHLMHRALLSLLLLSTVIRPCSVCRGIGMIHTFLPDPVPALVPSCARIIAGFRVPILRLQSRTLSCH